MRRKFGARGVCEERGRAENLTGARVQPTPEDLKAIHDAISAIDVQEDRFPLNFNP